MKNIFRSTSDSLSPPPKRAHNCPFCRCSFSSNTLASSNNLYLNNQHMLMTFNPSREQPCPSSQRLSITFSYSNPLKMRKHSSADAKFSTKRYKESRFPHLSSRELDEEAVLQIVKSKKGPTFINTVENTPPKHQLLKNNKSKSREKLGITSKQSQLESQSQQMPSQVEVKDEVPKQTPINYLKYETSPPLNQNSKSGAQGGAKKSQIRLSNIQPEADYFPTTLLSRMAEQTESKLAPKNTNNVAEKYPTTQSVAVFKADLKASKGNQEKAAKSYEDKALKSNEEKRFTGNEEKTFKASEERRFTGNEERGFRANEERGFRANEERGFRANEERGFKANEEKAVSKLKAVSAEEMQGVSETSLKVEEKEGGQKWKREVVMCQSDRELAQDLSEQLLLHYDYFVVLPESDRSLSACLSL